MKYVKRVESTLKQGCALDLGPKTLIVGPNGSGKTTVLQSITLAACGFALDVEERAEVHMHHALARLFPVDGPWTTKIELGETDPQLFSGADPAVFEWSLEQTDKKGFKKPPPSAMALHFPVQTTLAKLLGSPETMRAWLAEIICPKLSLADFLEKLPKAARKEAETFAKRHHTTDMLTLAKLAAKEATERKNRAEAKSETIERLMQGITAPLLSDRRAELEEEVRTIAQQLTSTAGGVSQSQMNAWRDAIDQKNVELMDLSHAIYAQQQRIATAPAPDPTEEAARQKADALYAMMRQHASVFGLTKCAICGNADAEEAISARVAVLVAHRQQLAASGNGGQQRALAEAELQRLRAAQTHITSEVSALVKQVNNTPVVVFAADAGAKQAELQALQKQIAEDDASKRSWQNREAGRLEVEQLNEEEAILKTLKRAFEKAGKQLLVDQKAEFEDRVTFFLPDKTDCQVDLETGRIGVVYDGGPFISTLSGGQGMQLLFALAEVLAPTGSTPSVLISPDRAWSGDTLGATMSALSESNHQVILTSTVEPDHEVPGWTVIRLPRPE